MRYILKGLHIMFIWESFCRLRIEKGAHCLIQTFLYGDARGCLWWSSLDNISFSEASDAAEVARFHVQKAVWVKAWSSVYLLSCRARLPWPVQDGQKEKDSQTAGNISSMHASRRFHVLHETWQCCFASSRLVDADHQPNLSYWQGTGQSPGYVPKNLLLQFIWSMECWREPTLQIGCGVQQNDYRSYIKRCSGYHKPDNSRCKPSSISVQLSATLLNLLFHAPTWCIFKKQ